MTQILFGAAIAVLFAAFLLWRRRKRRPDLGELRSYHYMTSGGMINSHYEIRLERDPAGRLWWYEIDAKEEEPFEKRIAYRYALPEDTLERLEHHLKEAGLWVAQPFAAARVEVRDAPPHVWSFSTDRGYFPICSAMLPDDRVRDRLHDLNCFVRSLRGDAVREKDPSYPRLKADEIVGIEVSDGLRSARICILPEERELLVDGSERVPLATGEELFRRALDEYAVRLASFGDAIWDRYPLDEPSPGLPVPSNSESPGYRIHLLVPSEQIGTRYDAIRKLGDPAPQSGVALIQSIYRLLDEQSKELQRMEMQ
ncbi:MAG: hypothetical protein Q4A52_00960 [Bacillota bacterium]|nr:hypothetical protein [Bacillota bacterium]